MTTYTDSPLDKALASAIPTYSAAHDGTLPDLAEGQHCYLLASDGLFVMGKGHGFHALIRLSTLARVTGFGDLSEGIYFTSGRVPRLLYEQAAERAISRSSGYWNDVIVLEDGAFLLGVFDVIEDAEGYAVDLRYSSDEAAWVVELFSCGEDDPNFTERDDELDAERVRLTVKLGCCSSRNALRSEARVSVNGHFLPVTDADWIEG